MSKELITVVTVCFNAGQTIAKTMQSVLNQTYRPLEYILVDGKSTDNTLNIISDYPFMHLLYSQLLVCQRVCLQNTVCLICK